jgi:hypothetical protein
VIEVAKALAAADGPRDVAAVGAQALYGAIDAFHHEGWTLLPAVLATGLPDHGC